jgi:hypothetical protein
MKMPTGMQHHPQEPAKPDGSKASGSQDVLRELIVNRRILKQLAKMLQDTMRTIQGNEKHLAQLTTGPGRSAMTDRLLDVAKWLLILLFAAVFFYAVCPKYEFHQKDGRVHLRTNKITGQVEKWAYYDWEPQ